MIKIAPVTHHFQSAALPMSDNRYQIQQRTYLMQASLPDNRLADGLHHDVLSRSLRREPTYTLDFLDISVAPRAQIDRSTVNHSGTHLISAPSAAKVKPTSWISSSGRSTGFIMEPQADVHELEDDDDDDDDEEEEQEQQHDRQPVSSACDESYSCFNDAAIARRKMKRFRLTHNQTRFLMEEFVKQPHPDAIRRDDLSREVPGLSPRQVQVWFQNRRAKLKRLSADGRQRMLRSRAKPEDLEPSIKQRSRLCEIVHDGTEQASSMSADGRPEPQRTMTRQPNIRSTFAVAPSTLPQSNKPQSSHNNTTAERRQRRRVRTRQETTLVFGREVTVYTDEDAATDSSGESIFSLTSSSESEDFIKPDHDRHRDAERQESDSIVEDQASSRQAWQHVGNWQSAGPSATYGRRSTVQDISHSRFVSPMQQQRPSYTSRPSWLAGDPSAMQNGLNLARAQNQSQWLR